MNSLEKLIAKHCPCGVEYKQLGEVCGYSDERITSSCITAHTYVGVESLLQEKRGRVDAQNVPSKGSVVAFHMGDVLVGNIRPYLKKIWLADIDGGTNGDVLVIQRNSEEEISAEYLYYLLSSDDFFSYDTQYAKGGKMPRGDKSAVMKYKIPVPPLPVQKEIVRMLDDMTGLISAIEEEIEARKKQYEWYRDKVLKLEGVERKSLGFLGGFYGGLSGKSKDDFVGGARASFQCNTGRFCLEWLAC